MYEDDMHAWMYFVKFVWMCVRIYWGMRDVPRYIQGYEEYVRVCGVHA